MPSHSSYALINTAAPAVETVTAADLKVQLNILDFTDDDAYLLTISKAARRYFENTADVTLVNTTLVLKLDSFTGFVPNIACAGVIRPPRAPLSSVTSIQYIDQDGATQTLATNLFIVDADTKPGRIVEEFNETWPETRDVPNAVTITYVAGHGATSSTVPEDAVAAIKLLAAHWYQMRVPVIKGTITSEVPKTFDMLFQGFRIQGAH